MNTAILKNTNIEVCRVTAPLAPEAAWEVESLLLQVFEYGDYSFRSALLGRYHKTLNCTFFLAKHKGKTIAAAGCLYARKNPTISIVGPVGVSSKYRRNGIGTKLVTSLIKHLELRGCRAVYLGVLDDNPAVNFFRGLGFRKYQGVVMRLLLCPKTQFEQDYFGQCAEVKIRRVDWGDFPPIPALASFPCLMYTVDFRRSIFSSRYVEPARFLTMFPEMMSTFTKYGGFANVLATVTSENVVGLAHISRLPGKTQQHIAELDFFVHDNFVEHAERLVSATMQESSSLPIDRVNCYFLHCDKIKKDIVEKLGGIWIATLPGNALVQGKYEDVLVYQLRGDMNVVCQK